MSDYLDKKETLKREYIEKIPEYYYYFDYVKTRLTKALVDEDIEYNHFDGRVKVPDSFIRKIERKKWKYQNPFEEITDILGFRIVTYYREDIDRIIKLLNKEFEIDFENSVNKLVNLDPDRMGYLSVHYVCKLKEENVPEGNRDLLDKNFKFEVQIRTALQHAWAAIDHKLRYKTLVNLPKKIERKLFRISALLEMADSEFSHIRDEIKAIEEFYRTSIEEANYRLRLDYSSVSFYLKANDKKILNMIKKLQVYSYNTFSIAKDEKLEKKLIKYALKFGLNRIEHLNNVLELMIENYELINEYLDETVKKKLRYLINSACTFFITAILLIYEDKEELKKIYKLSDESLDNILKLRKELLKNESK